MQIRSLATAAALAAFVAPLAAAGRAVGKPEDSGLSAERLGPIREAVQRSLDAGSPSGRCC